MKMNDPSLPIDIMLGSCLPDKKKLLGALSFLSPGNTVQVKIDDCVTSMALVESYLKSKLCRIVKAEEGDDFTILHIQMDADA